MERVLNYQIVPQAFEPCFAVTRQHGLHDDGKLVNSAARTH